MNDRELLELAAKAAGYDYVSPAGYIVVDGIPGNWNPLTDDGDALRLAVKLNLLIDCCTMCARPLPDDIDWLYGEGDDAAVRIRSAIVKVAAEIGRMMP